MHFALIAKDRTAAGTLDKRLASRPEHMTGLRAMKASVRVVDDGVMLDQMGNMVGSVTLLNFPDRDARDAYIAAEPCQQCGI